jgi:hypothetical protein
MARCKVVTSAKFKSGLGSLRLDESRLAENLLLWFPAILFSLSLLLRLPMIQLIETFVLINRFTSQANV